MGLENLDNERKPINVIMIIDINISSPGISEGR